MPRVTGAEVKEIIDTSLTDAQVAPFIAAASAMVDQYLGDAGLSDALLKEIERWLSAHLVAVRDPRAQSKGVGDLRIQYRGRTGLGLDATLYGQQVKALDPTGALASLDTQTRPWRYWAGSPPSREL